MAYDQEASHSTGRYDAVIYSRVFGSRAPGTHSLHLIEEADHNFTNVSFGSYPGNMMV